MMDFTLFILLFEIIYYIAIDVCADVVFDRSHTGVIFSPFAKRSENGVIPEFNQYTIEEIITMYEVVADKFQMTATYGTGANDEKYIHNVSYYRTREKNVLCPEAASIINRNRKSKALTVLIGVWRRGASPRQMNMEIELAFESATIANKNYRGTATGIIFHSNDIGASVPQAQETLDQITEYKERANRGGLNVGTRQDCELLTNTGDEYVMEAAKIFRYIIMQSDFIICNINPERKNLSQGVISVLGHVKQEIFQLRQEIKRVNPNIEVMVETGWPGKGTFGWENKENLVEYWKEVDKWASHVNIRVWMLEAFDMPWKQWTSQAAHFGWWKIKRNADAGRKDGYIQKILASDTEEPETTEEMVATSIWIYIGASIGGIGLVVLVSLIVLLYLRVNKLQEILSNDDIRDFVYGTSNKNGAEINGENGPIECALTVPYNKKFEMLKDKIDIKRESMLGSGQFGCVYKAIVETENGTMQEVALKMAKPSCPKYALKSLLSEIKILTYLAKHPNIVSIVGAYTGEMGKGIVYVATEICKLGSLEKYLRTEAFVNPNDAENCRYSNAPMSLLQQDGNVLYVNHLVISVQDLIRWSYEIACGMEYLGVKSVVHADLSTRNVLLTSDKTAKITDFGLSRRLYEYTNYVKQQQEPLPWRWLALESLKRLEFSSQSDVWSYGITLWEIFSLGDLPYPGLAWNLEFVDNLENGLRMNAPRYSTPEMYQVMQECWLIEPNHRPTFTMLKISTRKILQNSLNYNGQ